MFMNRFKAGHVKCVRAVFFGVNRLTRRELAEVSRSFDLWIETLPKHTGLFETGLDPLPDHT